MVVEVNRKATHPPIGSWVWGKQGIPYQVTSRYQKSGQYWLVLDTDFGPVRMPLDRVEGWAEDPPVEYEPCPATCEFQPGVRVISRSELDPPNTTGTIVEAYALRGKTYIKVEQDDGVLSFANTDWWAILTADEQKSNDWQPSPGDRVRCVTKALGNRSGQGALVVVAVEADGSILVRHPDWLPAIGALAVQASDLALVNYHD